MATTKQKRNSGSGRSLTRTVVEHSALFSGGLNTEVSDTVDAVPYTSDECNCDILSNGSRRRRLGIDYERGYKLLSYVSEEEGENSKDWSFNLFEWTDVKDRPGEQFLVLQTGLKLFFYKNKGAPYSYSVEMTKDGTAAYYVDVSGFVLEEYRGLPSAEIKSIEDEETLLYTIDAKGLFYDAGGVLLGSYKKEDDNENKVYKGVIENENEEVLFKIEDGFLKDAGTDQNVGKVFAEYKVTDGKPNWTVAEECKQDSLKFAEAYGNLFVCGKYIQPFCMRGLEPPEVGATDTEIARATAKIAFTGLKDDDYVKRKYYVERVFQVGPSLAYYSYGDFVGDYIVRMWRCICLRGWKKGDKAKKYEYKKAAGHLGIFDSNDEYVGHIDYDTRPMCARINEDDDTEQTFNIVSGRPVDCQENVIGSAILHYYKWRQDDWLVIDEISLNGHASLKPGNGLYYVHPVDDFGVKQAVSGNANGYKPWVRSALYYARVWNSLPEEYNRNIEAYAKTPFITENVYDDIYADEFLIFKTDSASLQGVSIYVTERYKEHRDATAYFEKAELSDVFLGYLRYAKTKGLSLKVRDFEGVLDVQDFTEEEGETTRVVKDVDFRNGDFISVCPQQLTQEHLYNLYNQGWTYTQIQEFANDSDTQTKLGYPEGVSGFPANNMQWFVAKKDFDEGSTTVRDFKPAELLNTSFGGALAPRGHYILDYFKQNREEITGFNFSEKALAETSKPRFNHVTDIIAYAGRIFYLIGNTVLYSQVIVEDFTKADKCYQEADPTSETISDLVDTDGGSIILSEIGVGVRFILAGGVLGVVGSRATALIGGGVSNVFTATAYTSSALMTVGTISPDSFVQTEEGLYYWATTGIAKLRTDSAGVSYEMVSKNSVQTLFDNIPDSCLRKCRAVYDKTAKQIIWMYPDEEDLSSFVNFLKLDIQKDLWSVYKIANKRSVRKTDEEDAGIDTTTPCIVSAISLEEPYRLQNEYYLYAEKEKGVFLPIALGAEDENGVWVPREDAYVSVEEPLQTEKIRYSSTLYAVKNPEDYTITFAMFNNNNYKDWAKADFNGDGYDYESYLVSHPILLQKEYQNKTIAYLLATFRRTEKGFDLLGNGIHPSACQGSIMWDWPENGNSGKWDAQQELYRYDRATVLDGKMVSSKTRVYGSGRALQIKLSSVGNKGFTVENVGFQAYVDGRI